VLSVADLDNLVVTVGGDISPLQDAFDSIIPAAQAAGSAIDAALAGGSTGELTGGLAAANDALSQFGGTAGDVVGDLNSLDAAFGGMGDAAATAVPQIEELPPSIHQVADAANEAEGGLAGTVEQLIQLAEALVVTEALKEFAGEALETYGNVQKAQISLTALTGSAEAADAILEQMKDLATSNALAFEPLVGAAQKMTALGFSTEQMNTALQAAANTAAATGNGFDTVTNAIERLTLSGTAGARQLVSLGLSTQALGTVMGIAATDVTAAFKALDQSQRLDVLTQALSKFQGVAEQVAQGILGQWQNLKTQWEFIMEAIGSALAPVAADILSFISSDVLPFIQNLVGAFNSLPGPVKDFVVVVGLAAAAVPILTLGLTALSKILETLEVLNLAEWGTATVAAVGNVAFAVSEGLVGALTAGETALLGLGAAAVVVAAGFAGWKLAEWLDQNSTAVHNFNTAWSNWLADTIPGLRSLENEFNGVEADAKAFNDQTIKMADQLKQMGVDIETGPNQSIYQFRDAVEAAAAAMMAAQGAAANYTTYQQNLATAVAAVQTAWGGQTMALVTAKTNLEATTLAYQGGTATLGQYQAAQKAVEAAQLAINPNFVTGKQAATELATATKDLSAGLTLLGTLTQAASTGTLTLTEAQTNLKAAQNNSESATTALLHAVNDLAAANALGTSGTNAQKAAVDVLKTAEENAKSAKTELSAAQKELTQAQKDATVVSKEQAQTDSDYATMLTTVGKSALMGYAVDLGAVTAAQDAYKAAVSNEGVLQYQLNTLIGQGQQASSDYKTVQLALSAAHQQVTADLKALNTTTQEYNTTSKDLQTAQKAIETSETQLQALYLSQSIPNVHDLTGQLQLLRDAKTQVAADTQAQTDDENALQDAITNMLMGTATIGDVTAATLALDQQRTQTTSDTKDLTSTETALTSAFGITKTAMQDITNVQDAMKTSTQNANAAFSALGIQSASSLQTLADKATTAFNTITASGTASPVQIQDAQIKMLQAVQAAYIAEGTNLNSTQQATLTDLLNKQTDFNNSMVNQWHNLYVTIEGDVSSLSNQLVTDLFTGSNSFGKDAIAGLEKIAAAFVSTLIQPVTAAIGKFIAGALTNLMNGFSQLASTATQTGSTIDLVFAGQSTGGAASGAASGVSGILGAASSALSGIVSAVAGIVGAVAGIIGDIQTIHTQNELYAIQTNTDYIKGYTEQTVALLWRLAADLEYGEMEKDLNLLASYGLKDLDAISGNSLYSLQALNAILAVLQRGIAGSSANVNVSGTDLSTVIEALDIINNTLVAESQTIPWFQTALQNINNGVVACAGWLQGIVGVLQSGISTAGSTTSASTTGLAALAGYVGANFTSLETWLFNALGKTMALPALPAPIGIPAALGGVDTTPGHGGVVVNNTVNVNGSVVGQGGMTQLTQTIGDGMVAALRRGGLKLA
jgi:hypothetical protein